jgi:hypothetical protein
MPADFDRRLRELLERAGCHFVRAGRHPIWFSPLSRRNFPVPTGIKSRHTANEVLKQAGLPKAF